MKLRGLAEVLPGSPVGNGEMAARFGLHERWLDRMTGNRTRYFCDAAGGPRNTGDLATAAGAKALTAAAVAPEDLEFLILTTASPDALMPATVNSVADRLGINGIPTFQLTSGCAGAMQGLYTARALLAAGLGRGLVIGADSVSRLWPADGLSRSMPPAELVNFALFGDGGGAVIVESDDGDPGLVLDHIVLKTVGLGRKPAQVVRWYGTDGAPKIQAADGSIVREPMGEEDYRAIAQQVPDLADRTFAEVLAAAGWECGEVDFVLVPQLNGIMSELIRRRLGVTEQQAISCVADTGNNGNALPFIQLTRALERIDPRASGERRLVVVTIESSKWIVAGAALRYRGRPAA